MAINYTEKGHGLHRAIGDAGHWLEERDGAWVSDDDAAVQAIVDAYPLSAAQAEVVARIDAHAAALRDRVTAGYSPAEMASWSVKFSQASAWLAAGKTATDSLAPALATEAAIRGVSTAAQVQKCLEKGAALLQIESAIAGTAGLHGDAVRALTTFGAVLAYDWTTGWPV